MKNILKEGSTTLIFISSLVVLMLSLSGCIGEGDNTGSNDYSIDNTIQENDASNNNPNTDSGIQENSNIIYPNSKPHSDVPEYYYAIMGSTQEDISLSAYETSDTVENVLKWYENKMTSLGYDVTANATTAKISSPQGIIEYGGIVFEKENDAITIWIVREPNQERTIYWMVKEPIDELLDSSEFSEYTETEEDTTTISNYEEEKPQLPTSDKVSGEEPIKRYPKSIMLEHAIVTMDNKKYTYIKYGTDKDPQDVFNWYKNHIKNEGWNVIYEVSDGSEYSIAFGKNNNEMISINIREEDYTTIDITYIVTQVDN